MNNFIKIFGSFKFSFVPPLMIYLAAGVSGITNIVGLFFVKEYLMPYWYKLLQTEIFPQNASLLFFWSSLFNSSGYAITKTGRFILDNFKPKRATTFIFNLIRNINRIHNSIMIG